MDEKLSMKVNELFEQDFPGTSKANRKYQNENNKPSKWTVSIETGPTAADVERFEVKAWSKELAGEAALRLAKKKGLRSPMVGEIVAIKEGLTEAFKLKDKIKIVSGPKDVVGKVGHIGEIRTDVQGKKTYTIDYYNDGSDAMRSVMLKADQIRSAK